MVGKRKICAAMTAALIMASLTLGGCGDLGNVNLTGAQGTGSSADGAAGDLQQVAACEEPNWNSGKAAGEEQSREAEVVYFSDKSGFYEKGFTLTLSCPNQSAKIYYTTDGSIPTESSYLYDGPLALEDKSKQPSVLSQRNDFNADNEPYVPTQEFTKANIIRAVAVFPDGSSSEVTNGTYFVGVDRKNKYGDVPVVSLITEEKNLTDYETGIMVNGKTYDDWIKEDPANQSKEGWESKGNYSNRGSDWERPVYFELIATDGNMNYGADLGMRIKGNASRGYYQKSLKLIAREEEYGIKNVKYPLIPDNMRADGAGLVEKYRSFILRNGGNDADYAKLRDSLLQSLVSDRNLVTQKSTPCVAFLNGEYWGVYAITEDYSDHFFENQYGVDDKDVIYVKRGELEEGEAEDLQSFNAMLEFLSGNDMTQEGNYAKAAEMLDLQSFADYVAFELYIYNQDSLFTWDNNWALWKSRSEDSKWQMVVYDTEFSTGIYDEGDNYNTNNLKEIFTLENAKDHEMARAFLQLYKNDEFRAMFVNALCDIRNINYAPQRVKDVLEEMAPAYKKLAYENVQRFGPSWVVQWRDPKTFTAEQIQNVEKFLSGRYREMPALMKNGLGIGNHAKLKVEVVASGNGAADTNGVSGSVLINASKLSIGASGSFEGVYFEEYPVKLTAKELPGHQFTGWEVSGGEIVSENGSELILKVSSDCSVKAIFE